MEFENTVTAIAVTIILVVFVSVCVSGYYMWKDNQLLKKGMEEYQKAMSQPDGGWETGYITFHTQQNSPENEDVIYRQPLDDAGEEE